MQIDDVRDYVDVYLFGVKQPQDRYEVVVDGNNIRTTFTVDITRLPEDVLTTDFEIKSFMPCSKSIVGLNPHSIPILDDETEYL